MPQKLNSSIFPLDIIFHTTVISSSKTQLKPSSVFNILGVSFSRDLSWKDNIISLPKQASKRLGVLRRLRGFLRHPSCLLCIGVLFAPVLRTPRTSGVVSYS